MNHELVELAFSLFLKPNYHFFIARAQTIPIYTDSSQPMIVDSSTQAMMISYCTLSEYIEPIKKHVFTSNG